MLYLCDNFSTWLLNTLFIPIYLKVEALDEIVVAAKLLKDDTGMQVILF